MAVEKGLGPAKRFGPRYGRTVKFKLAKIEKEQKKAQACPYCDMPKAKRVSAGIYECSKCKSKFTSRAYFVKKKSLRAAAAEQKEEAEA